MSNLYPPVAYGGYEPECAAVVERLRAEHDVLVLTSSRRRRQIPEQPEVWRRLDLLEQSAAGAIRAPLASIQAVRVARATLAWHPDLVYVWNGAAIPHAALRVLADSGIPVAFRVVEQWFGGLFTRDQFLRELLPSRRSAARAVWSAGCRVLNALPLLQLDPTARLRAAISWNSSMLKRTVETPPFVDAVIEEVQHNVPPHGEIYAAAERKPAPMAEIAFLGRVTRVKGLAVAIEALAKLRSAYDIHARLGVVGPEDEAYGRETRSLAQQLGVGDAIDWRGQLNAAEVAQVLASAHALIVPSLWDEPLGLVVIEGAFARVPIVAAAVGGIPEAVRDEEHALLFPRGDSSAAAAALARTLGDVEETAQRVERARQRAEAFRLGPYLDEQEAFIQRALRALEGPSRRAGV